MAPDITSLSSDPSDASTNNQEQTNTSEHGYPHEQNGAPYPHRNGTYSIPEITYYNPRNRKITDWSQGVWFVQIASNFGHNTEYSQEERDTFRRDRKALAAHAKDIEDQVNGLWDMFFSNSEAQKGGQELFRNRMAEFIKDKRLLEGESPALEGNRLDGSILTGRCQVLRLYGESNAERSHPATRTRKQSRRTMSMYTSPAVDKITEDGVVGADGIERKVNTIVCATCQ